jgi:hypothetical protein
MAEYIEREAVIDRLKRNLGACNPGSFSELCYRDAIETVKRFPASDVAPVVRCKDCNHYEMGVCLKIYSDGNVHPEAWQPRRPEDFCSYGERKEEQ